MEVQLQRREILNGRSFLSSPSSGTVGRVFQVDDENQTLLVQWNHVCIWWTKIFELIINSTTFAADSSACSFETQRVLSSVYALLNKIVTQQKQISGFLLDSKWNEITLYSFLCSFKQGELYPLLSASGETLNRLVRGGDPFQRLVKAGVSVEQAQQIAVRARNGGNQAEEFFFYSLSELLARSLCNSWAIIVPQKQARQPQSFVIDSGLSLELLSQSMALVTALVESPAFSVADIVNTIHAHFHSISFHDYWTNICCNSTSEFAVTLLPIINRQAISFAKSIQNKQLLHSFWQDAFVRFGGVNAKSGLLNRSDFEQMLVSANCSFPSVIVGHLFQLFGGEYGVIHHSHCALFFAGLDKNSIAAKNWFDVVERDLAESFKQLEKFSRAVNDEYEKDRTLSGEFSIKYLDVIFAELQYLTKHVTAESSELDRTTRFKLMLNCIESFETVASSLNSDGRITVCKEFVTPTYSFIWETVLQCALSLGLLAIKNKFDSLGKLKSTPKSFKELFASNKRDTSPDESSVLPIDFKTYLPALSLETMDYLIHLSLKSVDLLILLIDIAITGECTSALQVFRAIFCSRSPFLLSLVGENFTRRYNHFEQKKLYSTRTEEVGDRVTPYVVVIAGCMGISLVHSSKLLNMLKISYANLMTKSIVLLSANKLNGPIAAFSSSFASFFETVNFPGLLKILFENIAKLSTSDSLRDLKTASLSVLIAIGIFFQICTS